MNINYYLIHNLDENRYQNMTKLLKENNISLDNVKFINHPNKNELTYEIKRKIVQKIQRYLMAGLAVVTNIIWHYKILGRIISN